MEGFFPIFLLSLGTENCKEERKQKKKIGSSENHSFSTGAEPRRKYYILCYFPGGSVVTPKTHKIVNYRL